MKKIYSCLIILTILTIILTGCSSKEHMLTVGFIYTGAVSDQGINEAQEEARLETVSLYNGAVQSIVKEQANNENIYSVTEEMISSGATLIFISDNSLQDQIAELAQTHPDIDFVVYNGTIVAENIKNYSSRYYEVEYLSGMIAGKLTKNNLIGYISPNGTAQNLISINAFALGVLNTNPDAIVELDFTGDNPSRSRLNATLSKMEFDRIDVIGSCLADNTPLIEAAKRGIKVIAFSDTGLTDQENFVTGITLDLVDFYTSVIDSVLDGQFDNSRFVGTIANNFINLTELNSGTSETIKEIVDNTRNEIIKGNLAIFTGPFSDNAGNVRANDQQVLSEADLQSMDYVLSNVRILE